MKILKKKDLPGLFDAAAADYSLVAPVKNSLCDILLEEVVRVDGLPQGYVLPYNSLKDFFFPQSERLFPRRGGRAGKKRLFFGARPCDVKALSFQDIFFGRPPQDPYYLKRREASVVISVACAAPAKTCFCLFTGSGPYLEEGDGFDLQLTDIGDEYTVETGSSKGAAFVSAYKGLFKASTAARSKKRSASHRKCKDLMGRAYGMKKIRKMLERDDPVAFWKELGARCTNCGGCEFICPTCFCFNMRDRVSGKGAAERARSWDSCTFEGYGRMAGNFNPHALREERIKRRFYCKLYHTKEEYGMYACVGCGRCTAACPVNLEMESFVASVAKGGAYRSLLKEL